MLKNISNFGSIIDKTELKKISGGKDSGPFSNHITCWSGNTILFNVFPETSADYFKYASWCLDAGGSTIGPQ